MHRWRSAFTIRYGAFAHGAHWFAHELEHFRRAAGLGPGLEDHEKDELATEVQKILREGAAGINVTFAAELDADWVSRELPPELRYDNLEGAARLKVSFGSAPPVAISTEAFCWLEYRRRTGLTLATMPQEIVAAGRMALQRAAAQGNYSRVESSRAPRVKLSIHRPDRTKCTLTRFGLRSVRFEEL